MPSHKNFLIITQVFSPDPAAVGQYFDEAAQAIAGSGADVTVLTANRGYDNPDERFAAREDRDGIRIRRLPLSSFGKASIPVRIFAQLSFLVQCILRGLFTPKLTDLLVSTSPPMAAITAVIIGLFRPKLKVHYWVMDINPDQAVVLGAFGARHPLVLALDWLNRRILKRADSVIALDRFMADRMRAKLTKPETELRRPITILPPWPMDDYLETVEHSENSFRKEQGWGDKFVVMYSGNHSLVHPLDTILDAAEALKADPRFVFVFIGGGKGKQAIEERMLKPEDRGLKPEGKAYALNSRPAPLSSQSSALPSQFSALSSQPSIVSLPYQPLDQIRYSLSAADLHIVSLGDNMSGIVHPCKIYGALSIGRPVLTLGPKDSYLNDIVAPNPPSAISHPAVGWSIEHGDVTAAVAALKAAADQTHKERAAIGRRAQQVATEKFGREQLVEQFLDTILDE
jgi:colanic acid biosynthesis glycosyl transferase WcaI